MSALPIVSTRFVMAAAVCFLEPLDVYFGFVGWCGGYRRESKHLRDSGGENQWAVGPWRRLSLVGIAENML